MSWVVLFIYIFCALEISKQQKMKYVKPNLESKQMENRQHLALHRPCYIVCLFDINKKKIVMVIWSVHW